MIKSIADNPLLHSFSEEEIEQFIQSGIMRVKDYKSSQIVHFENEKCNNLEIVLDGKVRIERLTEDGHAFTIFDFEEGDVIGGNIVFSSKPHYLMTVKSLTDCKLIEINRDALFDLLKNNSEFLTIFLEYISDTTFIIGNKLKYHTSIPLRERIKTFLLAIHQDTRTNPIFLTTSKKEIAQALGCQRTSLSRELSKMEKDGLIEVNKDSILLKTIL